FSLKEIISHLASAALVAPLAPQIELWSTSQIRKRQLSSAKPSQVKSRRFAKHSGRLSVNCRCCRGRFMVCRLGRSCACKPTTRPREKSGCTTNHTQEFEATRTHHLS